VGHLSPFTVAAWNTRNSRGNGVEFPVSQAAKQWLLMRQMLHRAVMSVLGLCSSQICHCLAQLCAKDTSLFWSSNCQLVADSVECYDPAYQQSDGELVIPNEGAGSTCPVEYPVDDHGNERSGWDDSCLARLSHAAGQIYTCLDQKATRANTEYANGCGDSAVQRGKI
jgi:hypothetical protein